MDRMGLSVPGFVRFTSETTKLTGRSLILEVYAKSFHMKLTLFRIDPYGSFAFIGQTPSKPPDQFYLMGTKTSGLTFSPDGETFCPFPKRQRKLPKNVFNATPASVSFRQVKLNLFNN
jgi:hypothetical protein